eukprot:678889-Ditylum_brightwellii.AAC.1
MRFLSFLGCLEPDGEAISSLVSRCYRSGTCHQQPGQLWLVHVKNSLVAEFADGKFFIFLNKEQSTCLNPS